MSDAAIIDSSQRSRRRRTYAGVLLFVSLLVIAAIGLSIWYPWHREQVGKTALDEWKVPFEFDERPILPRWTERFVGQERYKQFSRVTSIRTSVLSSLRTWEASDHALQQFERFPHLERIVIVGSIFRNDALKHLTSLHRLQELNLGVTNVQEAEIHHLAKLTTLRHLSLERTYMPDSEVRHVCGLANLETLSLASNWHQDIVCADLGRMTNLRELDLYGNHISDAGVARLGGMTSLQVLNLDNTFITDAGLEHLAQLTNLRELSVWRTMATPEGIQKLRAKLPGCKINSEWRKREDSWYRP